MRALGQRHGPGPALRTERTLKKREARGFGSLWTNAVTIPAAFHACALWAVAGNVAGRVGH
jgi:hypothetical protein